MAELKFDVVVDLLKEKNINAYVEQTGGGTATIFAGMLRVRGIPSPDDNVRPISGYKRWDACAGPGWFRGPGWTNGVGDTSDFVVGRDDDGDGEYVSATDDWTEQRVADEIEKVVKQQG